MQNCDRSVPLLEKAKEREKRCDWLDAADFYEQASSLLSEDFLKVAELRERIGFCFFKAALQADTNDIFRDRMELAVKAYKKSVELLQSVKKNGKRAKLSHAKALVAYASSWLERDRTKRGKLLGEWWRLENEALEEYEKDGDLINIGKTCNNLLQFSHEYRIWLPTDFQDAKRMMDELLNLGEKSIKILSGLGDDYELARAYSYTGLYYSVAVWRIGGIEDRIKEAQQKSIEYSQKALMHSEKIPDSGIKGRAHGTAFMVQSIITGNGVIAAEHAKTSLKYAKITKDHYSLAKATCWLGMGIMILNNLEEDPEKLREGFQTAIKLMQESIDHYHKIVLYAHPIFQNYRQIVICLRLLAQNATDSKSATEILNKAVEVGREAIKYTDGYVERRTADAIGALTQALSTRAMVETKNSKKQRLLEESLEYCMKENEILERETPFINLYLISNQSDQVSIYAQLAKVEQKKEKKIELLNSSLAPIENNIKLVAKDIKVHHLTWVSSVYGAFCYSFGAPLSELYTLTKDIKVLSKSIEVYKSAVECYTIADTRSRVAEAYWQMATVYDRLGDSIESAHNYQLASENYKLAAEKIPQLKEFYNDYSLYMHAWSEIEKAKYSHEREQYDQSRSHYENAAKLHENLELWSYLAPNYWAWMQMEKAEDLSRKDETKNSIQAFKHAQEQFKKAELSIQSKIDEIFSPEEKEMATKLVEASGLRCRFCQARINIEEAKILDRKGNYSLSSKKYASASKSLKKIIEKMESEDISKKELMPIVTLCQAWQKMAQAEEQTSPELYLEAAKLFEQTKEYSLTKKAGLLALGNSSFCRGLAAGTRYEVTREQEHHFASKQHMEVAATFYLKAGFGSASEYAKATLRLFDAYLFMNNAEKEIDTEKKAKYFQAAEKMLMVSAGSFVKAKQPEKTAQVKRLMQRVKEEKLLATSIHELLNAPSAASSTTSFSSPTPTRENSVGLERFERANVQANLLADVQEVKVGESFCLTAEFVNAGKEDALLTRVEDFVPEGFKIVKRPEIYRLENEDLNLKGKQLAPLKFFEVKVVLQPYIRGMYSLKPKLRYYDALGTAKTLVIKSITIKVEEVILEDRVSTGTQELDSLLLGGIPKEYAVVLAGPPCDERETIVKNFLEAGTKEGITFYIATEATGLEDMLHKPNFYLFLCNPKPKVEVPDLPNMHKLQGKTDLTNISIALTKAIRSINKDMEQPKRICIEILSDVLMSHGPNTTRKWISGLITDLCSKSFTMLAVIDPSMHPPDQANAVLNLFDGEISLTKTKDALECKTSIRVEKLRNQDYIKNSICLT